MLGIESAEKIAATREADGKAIGWRLPPCRPRDRGLLHALQEGRSSAAVFAGWRDMNDYMRENKIEPVPPQLAAQAKGAVAETR